MLKNIGLVVCVVLGFYYFHVTPYNKINPLFWVFVAVMIVGLPMYLRNRMRGK